MRLGDEELEIASERCPSWWELPAMCIEGSWSKTKTYLKPKNSYEDSTVRNMPMVEELGKRKAF